MQHGDLLFGALVLRTQIEDLGTLLRLEQIQGQLRAERLANSEASEVGVSLPSIEEMLDFLWERFLPRFESPGVEEMGAKKPNAPVIELPNELYESVRALNDYVHPNYGSHMAAIFPETSASGSILLTAFNTAYDAFFKLDFVQQCPVRAVHGAPSHPVSYVKALRRFIERSLPRLTRVLQKTRGYPEEWAPQPFRIFTDRLKRETDRDGITADSLLQLDNGPERQNRLQEKMSTLRSLCSAVVPDREWSTEEILRFAEKQTVPTVALNTVMWVMLAHMRDLGHRLEVEAKQLPVEVLFPRQPPFDRWIGFTRDAIQLAVLATHRKIELMRFAAVRMINQRNPLGAILCARSLLEHYAVAKSLAERFNSDVKSIEQEARSGRDVVARFDRLEQDIGRFLIGTMATSELETKWKERWNRLGITKKLNIAAEVEHAFPQGDSRGFLYAYFSRCVHGDLLTGADLLRPGSELTVDVNLAKVVMVLADSETMGWMLDYWSPVTSALLRLTRPAGPSDAENFDELRRALHKGSTFGQPLKPGRDVFGTGTEADPYRFREDLQYHETYYQFCHEHSIDLAHSKRNHWFADGKPGDCLTTSDGKRFFFRSSGYVLTRL
ncbi:MAG: hypothetical protein Q8S00_32240 [Deltaproteobacteria bacterium]|nr:hypothetical protein [Deltaproteobacteria bacterium]